MNKFKKKISSIQKKTQLLPISTIIFLEVKLAWIYNYRYKFILYINLNFLKISILRHFCFKSIVKYILYFDNELLKLVIK